MHIVAPNAEGKVQKKKTPAPPPKKNEGKERVPNEGMTRARKHSQEPDRAAPTTAPAPTGTRTNTYTYSNGCSVHDGEFASVTSRMVNPLTRYGWTISGRRCASGEPEEEGNGREERRRQNQKGTKTSLVQGFSASTVATPSQYLHRSPTTILDLARRLYRRHRS